MSILVTGFRPNDDGLNSSEVLVRSLEKDLPEGLAKISAKIRFEIMPPDTDKIGYALEKCIDLYDVKISVLTGQAPGRNKIGLERVATNLKDFGSLDGAGNQPKGEAIIKNGPLGYRSTLPIQQDIVDRLNSAYIPAFISNYSGTHLCNQMLYHCLHYAAKRRPNMKCGFVHFPLLPEQLVDRWSTYPFMSLEMMRKAISIILFEIDRYIFDKGLHQS